ncbi:MAG: hypothetical protein JXB00_14700, partial [Bacteroidales bacterium]|nr:hypothetical protein [Bacteroidales bacterium]
MNKIINILLSILLIFAVSGCSKDENGNLPDDMKDAALAYLQLEATSDELVDLNNVDDFNLDYTVNTLFEPAFQKLTLVVVYNSDYANQYVLVDNITAVPVTGTITMANLVNAIPALNTSADVAEGDNFHFFVNATLEDGTFLPQFMALGSDPTKATQLVSPNLALALNEIKGVAQFDLKIPVPCAFNLSDYIGTLNCIEDWGGGETYEYTVDVAEDAEYTGDKIGIVITGIFDGAGISVTKMEINPKNLKLVMDEEQMVIEDIT